MSTMHVQALYGPVSSQRIGHPVKRLLATVAVWQQRYALRRHLLELDLRLLEDIGMSRAKARQEAAKPFWQD